jgi:hypothetical protein
MLIRYLFCFGAASILVAGCSSRPRVTPSVDLQAGARTAPADHAGEHGETILLWARNEKGDEKTFRLAADGPLKVLNEERGIIIATSKGEMKWKATEKEINLAGCSHGDGTEPVPSKGTITIASLVPVSGEGSQSIVDPSASEGDDIEDLQHSAGLVGSIGPYLFIQESSYLYACGAHGGTTMAAMVWDAEQGKTVDVLAELPSKDALATKAKKMLDEADDGVGGTADSEDKPNPVILLPVYGDRGALRFEVQFAGWACYACSDGQWSSYTRSAVVPTEWIPERMRAWVMPPVVVKEFAEKTPEWRVRGWSRR